MKTSTPRFPKRRPPLHTYLRNLGDSAIMNESDRPLRSPNLSSIRGSKRKNARIPENYREEPLFDSFEAWRTSSSSEDEVDQPPENYEPFAHKTIHKQPESARLPVAPLLTASKGNGTQVPLWCYFILPAFLVCAYVAVDIVTKAKPKQSYSLSEIEKEFPEQDSNLWLSFTTAMEEIDEFKKPWNIMLLYDYGTEETLNNLLPRLAEYSACYLRNCGRTPLILTEETLNIPRYINDYGVFIDEVKPSLESNGVLVVKNLDNVEGSVGQAFHTICDEFTPFVERALIIFTLRTNHPGEGLNGVEQILRSKWRGIDSDIFEALFTRITSTVIQIKPEH